jgi:DNA-binding transcriptional regulator YiaG
VAIFAEQWRDGIAQLVYGARVDTDALEHALAEARTRRRLPAPSRRRRLRERAGLSQRAVARALGVTREAVAYWEAGHRTPRAAHAAAYVALLDRLAREQRSP